MLVFVVEEEDVGVVVVLLPSADSTVSTVSAVPTLPTRLRSEGGRLVSRFLRMDGGGVSMVLRAGDVGTTEEDSEEVFRFVGVDDDDDDVEEQSWLQ